MANEPDHHGPKKFAGFLSETLPTLRRADDQHYELEDLTRLADARRARGEAWEMPDHLSRCALCLEAFQAILEGVTALSSTTRQRFVALRTSRQPAPSKVVAFPSVWGILFKVAAVVAFLAVASGLIRHFQGPAPFQVTTGSIAVPAGRVLSHGTGIPSGVTVTATEETRATLTDGSQVELSRNTQFSFQQSGRGDTTIALTTGKLVASVAKQKPGQEFRVTTPLGVVTVVGTRFSVSCQSEDVVVYQSMAGEAGAKQHPDVVRAMRVAVFAGVVRVSRQREQVSVAANQTAVLRESDPGIEVLGEKP